MLEKRTRRGLTMNQEGQESTTIRYVYWEDSGDWLGYLEEFPDYWTQGTSFEDLEDHLADILRTLVQQR
jgi:hypothetical protein